ncbi:hypothetical protein CPB84DRAFT_1847127 [Gymnopilus junonius]|uniref:Uncharacterized protein n=1 Tax=Gymnopilus junonius TaxID=109634 RepID=A0A9P5NNJ4_GYMJU|nr:hypothetical protein CPB84DRAFT_1847127 [Gymnopilus junonius]
MKAFIRDGTLYFFLILLTLLIGTLDYFLAKNMLSKLYQPWPTAIFTIVGTRLILNLREAAAKPVMLGDSTIFRGLETSVGFGGNLRIDLKRWS